MFHEFPKMLYLGDAQVIARDADHEAQFRAEGWHDFGDAPKAKAEETPVATDSSADTASDAQQPKARRGRPPKAKAEE